MTDLYPSTAARTRARLISLLGMAVVTAAFVTACFLYWRETPEPIVDFGREIYVPWRIQAGGEALYRDIEFFNGPLSAYVHAGVFMAARPLGGANLQVLKLFNAGVAWLVAILIYRLVRAATNGDDLAATIAGVGYALMFAVQQYRGANYNFITPYSYELPHGVALSLAMIGCLYKAARSRSRQIVWLSIGGVMLGLVFLTKAEVFVAALAAAIVGIVCLLRARARMFRDAAEIVGIFSGYCVATIVLGVLLLTIAMSPGDAVRGVLGSFKFIGNGQLMSMPYFKWLMGTDDLDRSMEELFGWLAAYAAVFAAPAALGWFLGRLSGARRAAAAWRQRSVTYLSVSVAIVLAAFLVAALMFFTVFRAPRPGELVIPWPGALRPLPVVVLVCAALIVQMILNRPRSAAVDFVLPAALVMFGGVLLGKIILNVHAYHYGFALALPAFLVLVMATIGWLPQGVRAATGSAAAAWVPRLSALAAIGMTIGVHATLTYADAARRTDPVGVRDDQFFVEHHGYGPILDQLLLDLRAQTTKNDTLVSMPEGLLINFLARRANPTGHLNFNPASLAMFGEDQILADLKANPPDYITIVYQDTHLYGVKAFGQDYAQKIWAWVVSSYEPVKVYGAVPYEEPGPGIALMKRKGAGTTGAPAPAPTSAPTAAPATAPVASR